MIENSGSVLKVSNGLFTEWYQNGQKEYEGNWKDGKRDGLFTSWERKGGKSRLVNFIDGKFTEFWDFVNKIQMTSK